MQWSCSRYLCDAQTDGMMANDSAHCWTASDSSARKVAHERWCRAAVVVATVA